MKNLKRFKMRELPVNEHTNKKGVAHGVPFQFVRNKSNKYQNAISTIFTGKMFTAVNGMMIIKI